MRKSTKAVIAALSASIMCAVPVAASFAGAAAVTGITAEAASETIQYIDSNHVRVGDVTYTYSTRSKVASVHGVYGSKSSYDLVIPGQLNLGSKGTFRVDDIETKAFMNNKKIRSLDLSNAYNLSYIHEDAFNGATGLKSVKLGNSVACISARAFMNCSNLETFDTNGNTRIGRIFGSAFENCTKLSSFELPTSCIEIIQRAFANTGLTTLKIPNTLTSIGPSAFVDCKKLTTLEFEASNDGAPGLSIAGYAFKNNTALSSVNFDRKGITAALTSFEGCGKDFKSYGAGQLDYIRDLCRKLLSRWNLRYDSSFTEAEQKQFFTKLEENLFEYIEYGKFNQQAQEGCAATVLSARKGTCGGFARVYYNLCLEAGVPAGNVLFAGDNHCHAWNYVKCGSKWYNIDAANGIGLCGNKEFIRIMGFKTNVSAHDPKNWIAAVNALLGSTDSEKYLTSVTKKFDDLLKSGSECNVRFSGTRVS